MRNSRFVAILLTVVVSSGLIVSDVDGADAPATHPAAETLPAADDSPQSLVNALYQAMFDGDEAAILDKFLITSPADKTAIQSRYSAQTALQRLQKEINAAFGDKTKRVPGAVASVTDLEKELDGAQTRFSGDNAIMWTPDQPALFRFRRIDDHWKFDIVRYRLDESPASDAANAQTIEHATVIAQVANDVKSHKFQTADEALAALDQRTKKFTDPAAQDLQRTATTRETLKTVRLALLTFEVDMARYPTAAEGLDALVHDPHTDTGWHQDLEKLPLDAWNHPFTYRVPGTKGNNFDLISPGPDGKVGTPDDIILSE